MRKYGLFIIMSIFIIMMAGCHKLVTTDDLIGGKWVPTSANIDGQPSGEAPYLYLTDDIKEEIGNIRDYMTEENIEQLKVRLNKNVVHSQKALDKEIAIIQAYLYLGDKRPSETDVSMTDRGKLTAYLMLLKNYDQALNMSVDPAIKVGSLKYEENRNGIPGDYFYSELEYAIVPKYPKETKESYRKRVFHLDKSDKVYVVADIHYYTGNDAFLSVYREQKWENEWENNLKVLKGVAAAGRLRMEFGLTETKDQRGKGTEITDIQMIPTETTFQILDRWLEAREVYPEMPFPDEALERENWYEVSETLRDVKVKYGRDMSYFISGEQLPEGKTIEDIEIDKD